MTSEDPREQSYPERRPAAERMYLTTEDYDNIWLRVKDKGIRWVLTWVTFIVSLITILIATVTFLAFNNYVQEKALNLTRIYVSSPEFKKEASDSLSSFLIVNKDKINDLKLQLKLIKDSIRLVSGITTAPYEVHTDGVSFVDSTGAQFRIEYGSSETDKQILFKHNFVETPLVYFTATTQFTQTMHDPSVKQTTKTSNIYPIVLDSASRGGFMVKLDTRYAPWGFSGSQKFNWIAIGR